MQICKIANNAKLTDIQINKNVNIQHCKIAKLQTCRIGKHANNKHVQFQKNNYAKL